jgi:hypothetical protein
MARPPVIEKTWTLEEFVIEKIHNIFLEIAEVVNNTPMTLEQSASIPMKLFQGETLLIKVWKQYMERELK